MLLINKRKKEKIVELNEDVTVDLLSKKNVRELKEKFKAKEVKVRKPLKKQEKKIRHF